MKLAALSLAVVPALVAAHAPGAPHHARQANTSSTPTSSPAASQTTNAQNPSLPPVAAPTAPLQSSLTFTLSATNPSAVPLSQIASGESARPTVGATTTFSAGTVPTHYSNAPPLPSNALSLVVSSYPPLDRPPPVDSPEVAQWKQEVANSGIKIPDIPVNNVNGCAGNPDAAKNAEKNGWWTCGGYTRPADVVDCPDKMTWGLTYDDGPAPYTPELLTYLDQKNLKATFFVVGSRALSYPALLQEEYMAGHQIAVHTWSHFQMTTLTNDQLIAEFGWSRKIIKDVIGVTPTYWRPPFGDVDDRVRAIAQAMGLQTSIWTRISPVATYDTQDFEIAGGTVSSFQVLNNWHAIIGNASESNHGIIVLEHDLFQQAVEIATGYILPDALAQNPKFDIKPIISCLNKPMQDAYIETNDNKTNPLTGSVIPTFTSGQAGSAQATGGDAKPGKSGALASAYSLPAFVTAAFGVLAGAANFLF